MGYVLKKITLLISPPYLTVFFVVATGNVTSSANCREGTGEA